MHGLFRRIPCPVITRKGISPPMNAERGNFGRMQDSGSTSPHAPSAGKNFGMLSTAWTCVYCSAPFWRRPLRATWRAIFPPSPERFPMQSAAEEAEVRSVLARGKRQSLDTPAIGAHVRTGALYFSTPGRKAGARFTTARPAENESKPRISKEPRPAQVAEGSSEDPVEENPKAKLGVAAHCLPPPRSIPRDERNLQRPSGQHGVREACSRWALCSS
jgi:hypothetical protein